jgi:hypothetical protein
MTLTRPFKEGEDVVVISSRRNTNALTRLVLAGVRIEGTSIRNGVIVGEGTRAEIVSVRAEHATFPLVFSGGGVVANSVFSPLPNGQTKYTLSGQAVTATFNTYLDGVSCSGSSLTASDSLFAQDPTCVGDRLLTVAPLGTDTPPATAIDQCVARTDLAFDVDLRRRPVGAGFDCGAHEAAR